MILDDTSTSQSERSLENSNISLGKWYWTRRVVHRERCVENSNICLGRWYWRREVVHRERDVLKTVTSVLVDGTGRDE